MSMSTILRRLLCTVVVALSAASCSDHEILAPESSTEESALDLTDAATLVPNFAAVPFGQAYAYVTNGADNTVSVIDVSTDMVAATIPVGPAPLGLDITPDGAKIFVANTGDATISVLDPLTNTVTNTFSTGTFGPRYVGVSPLGDKAYVSSSASALHIVDISAETSTTLFNGGRNGRFGFTPDGAVVYQTMEAPPDVRVFDVATNTQIGSDITNPMRPEDVDVAPDGLHAYVADCNAGGIQEIDTNTNTVVRTISSVFCPWRVRLTPDGTKAVVLGSSNNPTLAVHELPSGNILGSVSLATPNGFPRGLALSPDGTKAYVAMSAFNTVSVVDVGSVSVTGTITVGTGPQDIVISPIASLPIGSCPAADLLHWWPADGNSALDVIGSAHLASINGAGFTTGISGEAFDLSGTSHFTTGPFASPLTGDLTVDFWFNPNSTSHSDFGSPLASADNGSAAGSIQFEYAAVGSQYNFDAFDNGDRQVWYSEPFQGTWKHVAVSYDDATQTATVYVDGQLAVAPVGVTSEPNPISLGTAMRLNLIKLGINRSNSRVWDGLVDEVHVFDRALTAAEVAGIHANGCGTPPTGPDLSVEFPGLSGVKAQLRQSDGQPGTFGPNIQTLNNQTDFAEFTIADGTYDVRLLKGPAELVVDDVVVSGPTVVSGLVATLSADLEALTGVKLQLRIDDGQPGTFGANVETLNNQSGIAQVIVLNGSYDVRLLKGPAEHVVDAVDCAGAVCATSDAVGTLSVDLGALTGIKIQVRIDDGQAGTYGANVQTLNNQSGVVGIPVLKTSYDVRLVDGPTETVFDAIDCTGETCAVSMLGAVLTVDLGALTGIKIQVREDDGQPATYGTNVLTLNSQSGVVQIPVLKNSYDIRLLKGPAEQVQDAIDCTSGACATADADGTLSVDLGVLTGIKIQVRIDDSQSGTFGANVETFNNQSGIVQIPVLKSSYDVRVIDGPSETVFDAVDCTGETCAVNMLGVTLTVDLGALSGIKIQVREDDGLPGTFGANVQTLNNQSGVVQIPVLTNSYDIRLLKGPAEHVQDAIDCTSGTCATTDADGTLSVDLEGMTGVKVQVRIDDGLPGTFGSNVETFNNQAGVVQIPVLKSTYDVRLLDGPAEYVEDAVDCTGETCGTGDAVAQLTANLGTLSGVKVQVRVDDGLPGTAGANIQTLNNQSSSSLFDVLKNTYDVRMVDGGAETINDAVDCTGETCLTTFGSTPIGSCPTAALLHWWPADGASAADVIGSANLTSINGAGFTAGYQNEGFDLTGTGGGAGYFKTTFAAPLAGSVSIDLWFNPNGPSQQNFAGVVSSNDNSGVDGSFQIEYATSGPQYNFDVATVGTDPQVWFSDPFQSAWKHVAITYDATTQTATTYVDGQLAVPPGGTTSAPNPSVLASPLMIELIKLGFNRDQSRPFDGLVDEVHVFDRALTASEVAGIHANGCGTPPPPPSGSGPVASWSFDEGAGQLAADAVATHHGQLGSSPTVDADDPSWIVDGQSGNALSFSTQFNTRVLVANSAALEPSEISVEAWVRSAIVPGGITYVVAKGAEACQRASYALYGIGVSGLSFYVASGGGLTAGSPAVAAGAIWDGLWHHVVGTYDGSDVRLYVDGGEIGSGIPNTDPIEYNLPSRDLTFGSYVGSCTLGFIGDSDEVTIWDRALSPAEVAARAAS